MKSTKLEIGLKNTNDANKRILDKQYLHSNRFHKYSIRLTLLAFIVPIMFLFCPYVAAIETGERLFVQHCSGCHINGGNIIRRSKTLKLSSLKRNGLDNEDDIAKVAREGIGSMSGYIEVLGEGGDKLVANWIWKQAQNAWVQG